MKLEEIELKNVGITSLEASLLYRRYYQKKVMENNKQLTMHNTIRTKEEFFNMEGFAHIGALKIFPKTLSIIKIADNKRGKNRRR